MIREQDRMDALAVLNAMSDVEYLPIGQIASQAKLTPARVQRVIREYPIPNAPQFQGGAKRKAQYDQTTHPRNHSSLIPSTASASPMVRLSHLPHS
jgi:hypothetical protein